jgi:hypothetical protein
LGFQAHTFPLATWRPASLGSHASIVASSKLYNNYNHDFWKHGRWLDKQVILSTSNIIHFFEYVYKTPEGGE